MTAPFGIRAALEYRNVEPGKSKIWGAIKVEALGPSLEAERAPLAVALVVDVSGSMAGEPLEHALRSCESMSMSELMGPSEQLAIVTFSTQGSVLCGLTTLDEPGRALVRASLRGARAQGNTNLHDGLGVAAGVLQRAPVGLRRVMVVLSDGKPNQGLASPGELASYVRGLGIAVSCLGFGRSYDEDVLDAIATAGSGRYKQVTDPALARVDLARAVNAQGGIVADRLTLRLRPAEGVQVVQLLPASQLRFGSDGATASLGDVFKDEARAFAVELELDLGDHASGRLLEVVIDGHTPDGALHEASATLELDVRAGEQIADPVLQADAARADARAQADRRSTPAAVSILRAMLARIDALPGFAQNDGSILAELREQMADEAASYERKATDMGARPSAQVRARLQAGYASVCASRAPEACDRRAPDRRGRPGPGSQRPVIERERHRAFSRLRHRRGRRLVEPQPRPHPMARRSLPVVDMGATHGTSVNGQSIQSARLADGDLVKLGEAVFRFEVITPQLALWEAR